MLKPWAVPSSQVISEFKTNRIHGLGSREARARLARHGPNELPASPPPSAFGRFIRQFYNPLTLLLCLTLILTVSQHQTADSVIIAVVVVVNAVVGFLQEQKAEAVTGHLQRLLSPHARIIRDSVAQRSLAKYAVPGDIIRLEAGDRVSADGRVLDSRALLVNEAPLTGEALPQAKREGLLSPTTGVADRTNMVYAGTLVVGGTATMVVTATGATTELGQIASRVRSLPDRPETLTRQMNQLGLGLLGIGAVLAIGVLAVGVARGNSLLSMVTLVASLLVSMVPEGLPVAVTIVLAVGVGKIWRAGGVIRRLASAETLGSVSVIAVDKTGTLTEDRLTVEKLVVAGQELAVSGDGYRLSGHFSRSGERLDISKQPATRLLLELCSLSTLAAVGPADLQRDEITSSTDPTETALAVVAAKAGFYAFKEEKVHPELLELPYDHHRHATVSVHHYAGKQRLIVKGEPEAIINRCREQVALTGQSRRLLEESRTALREAADRLAGQGYRVIAVAYRDQPKKSRLVLDQVGDLTFAGLLALGDQLRLDARPAIAQAQAAGVKVLMLTGDHLLTAATIAAKAGVSQSPVALHADELEHRSLAAVDVIARLSPEQKLQIVEKLQKSGAVVAMTGDGINDTMALKAADIGIAIGRGGSDAAQATADMVLFGNHFQAIVAAIQEGRLLWANLRKIVYYLVSTSIAEALVLLGALALGWPLLLTAVQILWMNLVTDGVTSAAHAFEPPETHLMTPSGRLSGRSLLDAAMLRRILLSTVTMTIGTLLLVRPVLGNLALARTVAVTTMVFFQVFNLFASRSETRSIFHLPLGGNRPLLALFAVSVGLQILAVYHPLGNRLLGTVPLAVPTLLACSGVALTIIAVDELRKWIVRQFKLWAKNQQTLYE